MNLGDIVWPRSREEAAAKLLAFYVAEIEAAAITFEPSLPDPVELARGHLDGRVSTEDLVAARAPRKRFLETTGGTRFPATHAHAVARLAISVLSVTPDRAEGFVDDLDWFLQTLRATGANTRGALARVEAHFAERST